jgi:uncharacterized membrane protein YbhN (UPF0104 family)
MSASIIFIITKILSFGIDWNIITEQKFFPIAFFALVAQIILSILIAYLYILNLEFNSGCKTSKNNVMELYLKSILLKYIPGNVMHYVGRNVLGVQYNIKQRVITLSTVIEIAFYCFTSFLLCIFLAKNEFKITIGKYIQIIDIRIMSFVIGAIIIVLLILCVFFKNSIYKFIKKFIKPNFLFLTVKYIACYMLFFFLGGTVLYFLIRLNNNTFGTSVFYVIAVYVLASFIGTITIGAPGGIGVREAVLLLFLGTVCGESAVISAAILQRFIFVLAEVLTYIVYKIFVYRFFIWIDKNI